MIRSDNQKKQALLIAAVLFTAVLVVATAPTSASDNDYIYILADKTVYNSTSGEWVKALTAKMNDTLQFTCTITNPSCVNLTQVRFWDIMECSLQYEIHSVKINGTDVTLDYYPSYRFKPRVLHPLCEDWIGDPISKEFEFLCPSCGSCWKIINWMDHDGDLNVSVCDQVFAELVQCMDLNDQLQSPNCGHWYHVDRLPYTLNLSNGAYFDSVLNWNDPGMNLSNPLNSTWFYPCGCKDLYTLIEWQDCGEGNNGQLGWHDFVTLLNERTQEKVEEYVEEVAIDLVVSREYEIADYLCGFEQLEPGQTITIEYNATVVRCGVDNNTFRAKGQEFGLYYSNEAVVTITVPCQSGEATDPTGFSKAVYTFGEPVYAVGSGFKANKDVDIYIVPFQTLTDGVAINTLEIIVGPVPVTTNETGEIGPVQIWPNPIPGVYLMIFDDPQGTYYQFEDALDQFTVTGGAAPLITPLGIVALLVLLSIVATSTLVRKRRK